MGEGRDSGSEGNKTGVVDPSKSRSVCDISKLGVSKEDMGLWDAFSK